jgi:hypothetical protein
VSSRISGFTIVGAGVDEVCKLCARILGRLVQRFIYCHQAVCHVQCLCAFVQSGVSAVARALSWTVARANRE